MVEGKGKICPVCFDHMITLSSMNKRICDCGYHELIIEKDKKDNEKIIHS